jgi:hypothetical protein
MQNRVIIVSDDKYKAFQRYEKLSKLNRCLAIFTLLMFGIFVLNVVLLVEDNSTWSGKYAVGLDWIVIKGYDSPNYMVQVARHEIGHHVYYVTMNQTQRSEWVTLHDKSTANDYTTSYAKTNPQEDFAETFMRVTEKPNYCFIYKDAPTELISVLDEKFDFACKMYVEAEMRP